MAVNDAGAVYPVRIDPTFSDANWNSMGGIAGANGPVYAAVVDGSGNLYIGGRFTTVGDVLATNIAKWNGSSWAALGAEMNGPVRALAVSGNDVYAGGDFTTAGDKVSASLRRICSHRREVLPIPSWCSSLWRLRQAGSAVASSE